ncbi:NNMT/PNMT/TEMT family protein, partial [Dictyocaulus viviparus]
MHINIMFPRTINIVSGPTVYSALCFRDTVKKIFLSDYLLKNLDALKQWCNETTSHDWKPTIRVIKRTEGGLPVTMKEVEEIEAKARIAVKCGGIMYANVHEDPVVSDLAGQE